MRKVAIIFMKKCSVLLLMLLFPLGVLAQSVTVSGQQVSKMQSGNIYVVKTADGKMVKVVKK